MTSQEEQMIGSLIERVNSTRLSEKDPEAEALLQRDLGSNPDALYILSQTVLVQNMALEQAQAQVRSLNDQLRQAQQARQPAKATSFLGSLLGHRDPEPMPQPRPAIQPSAVYSPEPPVVYPPAPPQPAYGQPSYGQPGYGQPTYPQAGYMPQQYAPAPIGQPSFLRSAAQTAAGVAAGALVFEGVESLLHGGFGHPGMGGFAGGYGGMGGGFGMMGGAGFERPVEETVINNYYDAPGGGRDAASYEDRGGLQRQGYEHGGLETAGYDQDRYSSGEPEHSLRDSASGDALLSDAGYEPSNDAASDDLGMLGDQGFDPGSGDSGLGDGGFDGGGFDGGSGAGGF